MAPKRPFFGTYENKDGQLVDLWSQEESDMNISGKGKTPFNGVFHDKDGVLHDLSELIEKIGGGGDPTTETDPVYTADKPLLALKSDLEGKVDKVYVDVPLTEVPLASSKIGDDLSGKLLTFDKTVIPANMVPTITFSNGNYIGASADGAAFGLMGSNGAVVSEWYSLSDPSWVADNFTIPTGAGYMITGVTAETANSDLAKAISYEVGGYQKELTLDDYVTKEEFQAHCDTDVGRWQIVADLQTQLITLQAKLDNKILDPDPANTIDIEADANGAGYIVTAPLGGLVKFDLYAVLLGFGTVTVTDSNGVAKTESAQGLSLIEVLHKSMEAPSSSKVTCSTIGVDKITFTPYIASS
jgi:hypothetical protein